MRARYRAGIAAIGAGALCAGILPVAFGSGSAHVMTQTNVSQTRHANFTPNMPPTLNLIWHPSLQRTKLQTPAVAVKRLPRRMPRPVIRRRDHDGDFDNDWSDAPIRRLDHDGDYDNDWSDYHAPKPRNIPPTPPRIYGYYSCSMLEALWRSVGGNSGSAFLAAEIAMAESGGNPGAISPTNDYGLWQINGSHGALASLNPIANARAAVIVSGNGTNWSPWTTFVSGAYIGRC